MSKPFAGVVVDPGELRNYCLSETHPRGRHKARVFRSRLGLTAADAPVLRQALLDAAQNHADMLRPTGADAYGERYVLDFTMTTAAGTAIVRCLWIVRTGEDVLRLTACYVL